MSEQRRYTLFVLSAHIALSLTVAIAEAQCKPQTEMSAADRQRFLNEHVVYGVPQGSNEPLCVRQGYVLSYDQEGRVPQWVAYHVIPDYRRTPQREGGEKRFRTDPDVEDPVKDDDYLGLKKARGFARGHLAPYGVMGGDRDQDGKTAADGDEYDLKTVHEANYMSNVAPQHHNGFNGAGGVWYKLERWIQDELVQQGGQEVWIFAGCIFGSGEHEIVGPEEDIWVPAMFYKIVIRKPVEDADGPDVLAFLLPHHRSAHGEIEDYLVTIDVIEALTGLDFLHELDDETEEWLEDQDTSDFWDRFQPDERRTRSREDR